MEQSSGALGYRISNPPALLFPSFLASMEVFAQTNMDELRMKSTLLTAYTEQLLKFHFGENSVSLFGLVVDILFFGT